MSQQNTASLVKRATVILAVLLGFSFFTFVSYYVLCIGFNHLSYKTFMTNPQAIPMMTTNHILQSETVLDVKFTSENSNDTDIELYKDHPIENRQFQITDLQPGNTITQNLHIKIYHNQKTNLYYKTEITEQTQNIADKLTIRITCTNDDTILYEGKLKDLNRQELTISVNKNEQNVTIKDFRVDLVVDDTANEIEQQDELGLSVHWYVKEDASSTEDGGIINPPATGDLPPMSIFIIFTGTLLSVGVVVIICKEKKDI